MDQSLSVSTRKGRLGIRSGYVSEKGNHRKQNEDVAVIITNFLSQYPHECRSEGIVENPFSVYAVFDGHGGQRASLFASRNLPKVLLRRCRQERELSLILRYSILDLERMFLQTGYEDGTTALIVLITPDGRCAVANLGDCEGLLIYQPLRLADRHLRPLFRKESLYPFDPHNLNRSPIEICRVTAERGEIVDRRLCLRNENGEIVSLLAISRAIGDRDFKGKTPLSANPDIIERKLTGFEESMIIACDGLWDALNKDDVFSIVEKARDMNLDPVEIAQLLITMGYQHGSTDNITVIVILFD